MSDPRNPGPSSPPSPPSPARPSLRSRLLRLAAWGVTAGLLVFLFWRTPFSQVMAAARGAAGWTLPVALLVMVGIYLGDSFAIWKTFGWFLARLSLGQVLVVRGATYLLAVINYSVGQGAIVYFVHRATGAPVLRGVATVLLIMGVNILALLMLSTFGLFVAPEIPHGLYVLVIVAYIGLAIYIAAVVTRPRWLAKRPIFDVLMAAGLGGHLRALLVRVPHIVALVASNTLMLRAFGVHVPLVAAVACLPVVFFVGVLPISVQGIGTTQTAMVFFFARYAAGADQTAREAAVLAASLFWQVFSVAFQVLLGLVCVRSRTGRELRRSTADAVAGGPTGATPPNVAPPAPIAPL